MILIDADGLKKIISEEITRKFVRWDKTITVAEWETFTQDIIDNAPTVIKCGEYEGMPMISGDFTPRPQGEWEEPFEMNGKSYHKCTNCHISSELILINKYCPNCGADMRGEKK